MASPDISVVGPESSPVRGESKSFVSRAATEDEDTKMLDATTPDPAEKSSRSKGRGSKSQDPNQSSVGKIRHLKKDDGDPLWRRDIQYDFLKAIFDNPKPAFTNSYEPDTMPKQCFADLYIDTMARSSKTSKVLRDKLMSDREAAKGMAMVCLLVNIGRMNTTLNCKLRARHTCNHPFLLLVHRLDPSAHPLTLACLQSSPRCAHSYAPTTPYRPSRPTRMRTPTSSSRMPRA